MPLNRLPEKRPGLRCRCAELVPERHLRDVQPIRVIGVLEKPSPEHAGLTRAIGDRLQHALQRLPTLDVEADGAHAGTLFTAATRQIRRIRPCRTPGRRSAPFGKSPSPARTWRPISSG